jgi:hypothetical protein
MNVFKRMLREANVAKLVPGGTEENYKKLQSA